MAFILRGPFVRIFCDSSQIKKRVKIARTFHDSWIKTVKIIRTFNDK
jgi:hypothetical protein